MLVWKLLSLVSNTYNYGYFYGYWLVITSLHAHSFNNPDVCCLEMLVVRTLATVRIIYVA